VKLTRLRPGTALYDIFTASIFQPDPIRKSSVAPRPTSSVMKWGSTSAAA